MLRKKTHRPIIIFILSLMILTSSACSSLENNSTEYPADLELAAKEGRGMLFNSSGGRILILKGTPYEMGYQHGVLLKDDIAQLTSSIITECEKEKKGYLDQIWEQQKDLIPQRFLDEMEGIADGSGVPLRDIQLSNIMPELFHCSGIAVFGEATKDGSLLHVRVLDYIVDYGLQDHSVVIVASPDEGNSFINAGFAGFIGSVTGMNDKKISIGEMGGGGQGMWAGIPMSFLVRMVLEQSSTLDDGLNVFKNNLRTCEYYYVLADANIDDALAIYATPKILETLKPGISHDMLPLPPKEDTLVISGSDRYLTILKRIEENYGSIDKDVLIEMIKRPVSMSSNLHNAIFDPANSLMWLAVAASPDEEDFQACYQPYFQYDLKELLSIQ